MERLIKLIKLLVQENASHHRYGPIQSIPMSAVLSHLEDEVVEWQDDPTDIEEAGDILVIYLRACIINGWALKEVEEAAVRKVLRRFTMPPLLESNPLASVNLKELLELSDDVCIVVKSTRKLHCMAHSCDMRYDGKEFVHV